jgi:protein-S-isoprenylcysteine O-methyltransferase Ste14
MDLPLAKMIDMPPVWLALFLALAHVPVLSFPGAMLDHPVLDLVGGVLVGGGLVTMLLALVEMRRHRTTVIPHKEADALVTSGIFARSRNPIYLGDAMVLVGLILYWGAWPSLVLVPLFVWVIGDRFILPEEARLRARFGAAFDGWAERTRRWL